MGFWDSDVNGSFDEMFDMDHDGKLDMSERAMQLDYMEDEEREIEGYDSDDDEYDDDEYDEYDDDGYDDEF